MARTQSISRVWNLEILQHTRVNYSPRETPAMEVNRLTPGSGTDCLECNPCCPALHGIYKGLSWADAGASTFNCLYDGPRPGPSNFALSDRGLARSVKFTEDGPRPSPAHQISSVWTAARLSPSHLQNFPSWPGPSFFTVSVRPGPAAFVAARPLRHGLYIGWPDNYVGRTVDLTGRPIGRPV